jgi:putative endopeptidase
MSLKDFYKSVNKKWLESHTIPSDDVSYSVFDELEETVRDELIDILQKKRKDTSPFGLFVESFYTGRDNDLAVVTDLVKEVLAHPDLEQKLALLNLYGLGSPLSVDITYDQRNTKQYCIYLSPPTLSILKEEYITEGGIAKKYKAYLREIGQLLGQKQFGEQIYRLEKQLAPVYRDRQDEGDVDKTYNPMTYDRLCSQYRHIDFAKFFVAAQIPVPDRPIIVTNMEYLAALNELVGSRSAGFWDMWLTWSIYSSFMELLPRPYKSLHFDFFTRFIGGQEKHNTEDYECFMVCNEVAQDTLGRLYIEAHAAKFKEIQKGANEILSLVLAAAEKRILQVHWLSEDTRRLAVYKVHKMNSKIAYPTNWLDEFGGLKLSPRHFLLNVLALSKKSMLNDVRKLNGETPKERLMWNNACYDVNAYYYAELNELCIPIGFLRPPFFSPGQSFIRNLAGVGNIMAHEISHGFDEEGHKYDEYGNNFPWWTSMDIELYKTKTHVLIKEFDKQRHYGLKINGGLTLGENLADFGAMAICLDVLRTHFQKTRVTPAGRLASLREFFTAYAESWVFKNRAAARLQATKSDSHSPPELRVNVVLRHFGEFYEAFGFTETDEGWIPPEQRIDVWG